MKIYFAARYSEKDRIQGYSEELTNLFGIQITSTWPSEPHPPQSKMAEVETSTLIEYANRDLSEIQQAEWVVFFSVHPETPTVRGGRHVEFGYAMALGKKILVVGPRENIFHQLPIIHNVNNWEEAITFLVIQQGRE